MASGKSLRLRRIFATGRALIVDCDPCPEDLLGQVRQLTRAGVDAVILTPGLLDLVAEDLAGLSVILRIDGGMRWAQPLVSVQAAMEMGAEAVSLSVAIRGSGPSEAPERFGRITEAARRLGMPVFAEILGEDWLETALLCAGYGADVIQGPIIPSHTSYRTFIRQTGRPFLARLDEFQLTSLQLLGLVNDAFEGAAQGLVLGPGLLAQPECSPLLDAIHGLVHQGISVEEAWKIACPQEPEAGGQEAE
jgi:DhnA family fructose-bisphosphate aldolase class Ia